MENNVVTEINASMELVILFSKSDQVKDRKILAMFAAETQTPGSLSDEVDAISLTENQMLTLVAIYRKQKTTNAEKRRKYAVAQGTAYHQGFESGLQGTIIHL